MTTDLSDRFIPLPPHNPRLLVPFASRTIRNRSFLLYNPYSPTGKALKALARYASRCSLLKLGGAKRNPASFPFPPNIRPIVRSEALEALRCAWETSLAIQHPVFALLIGTPGPYQKVAALLFGEDDEPLAIAKIAATPQAQTLVRHEYTVLKRLSPLRRERCLIPEPLGFGEACGCVWHLQSLVPAGRPCPSDLLASHYDLLHKLCRTTRVDCELGLLPFWNHLSAAVSGRALSLSPAVADEAPFVRRLAEETASRLDAIARATWPVVAAHGDFAPWNMRLVDASLAVYDWEYFLPAAPAGWDILRFTVMVQRLLKKKPFEHIYQELLFADTLRSLLTEYERTNGIHIPDSKLLLDLMILDLAFEAGRAAICCNKAPLPRHYSPHTLAQ